MELPFGALFNFITKTGIVLGIILAAIMVLLQFFQNKLLYQPVVPGLPRRPEENPAGYRNPADVGLPFQNVNIVTEDGVDLHGWICLQKTNANIVPTVVYFHENAGNIGTRVHFMKYMYSECGVNIMLVAYRGQSNSAGEPGEQGIERDAVAIIQHILSRNDIDTNKIVIFGRSLGGAVGVYVASQSPFKVKALILENTFTSISDMVDIVFPKLAVLKRLVLRNHWPSTQRISSIQIPMLFVITMKDQLVPADHMIRLYDKASGSSQKEKLILDEGGHNDSWTIDTQKQFRALRAFIYKATD